MSFPKTSTEKLRLASRRAAALPVSLKPESILEVAAESANPISTPQQRLNTPMTFEDFAAAYVRRIDNDSSNSSANSDAATTPAGIATTATTPSQFSARNSGRTFRKGTFQLTSAAATPTSTRGTATTAALAEAHHTQNSNLFIRNLDLDVDQAEVDRVFSAFGKILSSAVMRNIHTGESLGTAFVRMSTHEEAARALDAMNGQVIGSRAITIQWARRHDGAPVGEARKKIMKLFVRNIPTDCSTRVLERVFGEYGAVKQVTLHKDTAPVEDPAMERLIAFVIYTEEGAAERAATAVHNTKPFDSCNGIPLMVKLAEDSARHDRHRHSDRYDQTPVSPQQQQQQQNIFRDPFNATTPATSGRGIRPPSSPANNDAISLRAAMNYEYYPPTAITSVMQERQSTPPTCNVLLRDGLVLQEVAPAPNTMLCSPMSPSLPYFMAVPLGEVSPTSFHISRQQHHQMTMNNTNNNNNNSYGEANFGGSFADFQSPATDMATFHLCQPLMPAAPQVTSPTMPHVARGSPDASMDSASRSSIAIPNPRSVARAAAVVSPSSMTSQSGNARGIVSARVGRPAVLSPCLRSDSPAMFEEAEAEADGMAPRSPLKYRHNPYSLFYSALVC